MIISKKIVAPEQPPFAGRRQHAALFVDEVQPDVGRIQVELAQARPEPRGVLLVGVPQIGMVLEHALGEAHRLLVRDVDVVAAHRRVQDAGQQQGGEHAEAGDQREDTKAQRLHRASMKR